MVEKDGKGRTKVNKERENKRRRVGGRETGRQKQRRKRGMVREEDEHL